MKKRTSARRAATFLAALGALVMSSGVALMVTATSADAAAQKITFCHSTASKSNPWNLITTSVNAFYVGHVLADHTSDVYPGVTFVKAGKTIVVAAQGNPDFIANGCESSEPQPGLATATVTPDQATCTDEASYTASGEHVSNFTESADPAAGTSIVVTAHAVQGFLFANESATQDFPLTFDPAPTNCGSVDAPKVCGQGTDHAGQVIPAGETASTFCNDKKTVVDAPKTTTKTKTKANAETAAVTPTVVEAGLTSVSTKDMRGEQGLALMVAGMVMLMGAGGLGLRLRGAASRI